MPFLINGEFQGPGDEALRVEQKQGLLKEAHQRLFRRLRAEVDFLRRLRGDAGRVDALIEKGEDRFAQEIGERTPLNAETDIGGVREKAVRLPRRCHFRALEGSSGFFWWNSRFNSSSFKTQSGFAPKSWSAFSIKPSASPYSPLRIFAKARW